MCVRLCIPALVLIFSLLGPIVFAQPGTLDPTFGEGGVVFVDSASVATVTPDANGRLITAGSKYVPGQSVLLRRGAAWRFHADGTPDHSFGGDGAIDVSDDAAWSVPATVHPGRPDTFTGIIPLPTGGAVIVGYVDERNFDGGVYGAVGRVLEDGALDSSFGDDGVVGRAPAPAVARVSSDGRLVVAGYSGGSAWSYPDCGALRLLPDGSSDPSFGDEGSVVLGVTEWPAPYPRCGGADVDASGRAVFAINEVEAASSGLRLLDDGSVDPSFDVVADVPVSRVFTEPDGYVTFVSFGPTLVRFTAEGEPDASFGQDGYADLSDLGIDVMDLAVQEDGKLLLAGWSSSGYHIARVLADGVLDSTFGEEGLIPVDAIVPGGAVRKVALDAEGRIVVAGWASDVVRKGFIARLLNDSAVASEPSVRPEGLTLSAPAPNPVSERAALTYTLAASAPVRLVLYDVLGREVSVLAAGTRSAGRHDVAIDASHLAPGLYVVRLSAGDEVATRRLTVIR